MPSKQDDSDLVLFERVDSTAMDASFALHQLGHSHNAETIGHSNGGQSVESIRSTVNSANRSER
jgi:hypothetical protein